MAKNKGAKLEDIGISYSREEFNKSMKIREMYYKLGIHSGYDQSRVYKNEQ